jgi:arginyl-tRNA--protein-N-Asp/Glu arginylyltransferase
MSVIDILPSCVSSVYFMWEKEYEKFSLGKVSPMKHIQRFTPSGLVTPAAQCLA